MLDGRLAVLGICAWFAMGCGDVGAYADESDEQEPARRVFPRIRAEGNVIERLPTGQVIADRMIKDGVEFTWVRKLEPTPRTREKPFPTVTEPTAMADLTEEQLAESLRAVVGFGGHQFIQSAPNHAAARRIKRYEALQRSGASRAELAAIFPGSAPSLGAAGGAEVADDFTPKALGIFPPDNRVVRNNLAYPFRTNFIWDNRVIDTTPPITLSINTSDGTATLIGRSTALSAAHVFWDADANAFEATFQWAPGFDSQDGNPAPWGWGYGCYWVSVPNGYDTGSSVNLAFDFAVIDFNVGCSTNFPGDTLGYLGTWIPSASQIAGTLRVDGYPARAFQNCGSPPGPCYDRIWGSSGAGATLVQTQIWHTIDTTGGQSGSAIYRNFDPPGSFGSGSYLFGNVIAAAKDGSTNVARVFDSTVYSFLVSASDDF